MRRLFHGYLGSVFLCRARPPHRLYRGPLYAPTWAVVLKREQASAATWPFVVVPSSSNFTWGGARLDLAANPQAPLALATPCRTRDRPQWVFFQMSHNFAQYSLNILSTFLPRPS